MYIKSFKVFETKVYVRSGGVESKFSDKINYNLINDLKDRSLDLIDYGYTLRLSIFYNTRRIFYLIFSHEEVRFKWIEGGDKCDKRYQNIDEFLYLFDYSNNVEELCYDYEHKEVESIIKDMYPNENIILYTDPHSNK